MNLRKLSDKELVTLINSSSDTRLIESLENEYIRRMELPDEISDEDNELIIREINKSWRQG